MMVLAAVKRSAVETAYERGLVKPNEMQQLVDDLINQEQELREKSTQGGSWVTSLLTGNRAKSEFGLTQEKAEILNQAYFDNYEYFLLEEDKVKMLKLADIIRSRMLKVRDLGDVARTHEVDDTQPIFADKATIRALSYLIQHKQSVYDLLNIVRGK